MTRPTWLMRSLLAVALVPLVLTLVLQARAAPPAAPTRATVQVTIQNFAFSPQTITVAPGTRVVWTQKDSTAHTVSSNTGAWPDSGSLAQGKTFAHTFTKPGTYSYHCSIHPFMTAKVVVTAAARTTAASGTVDWPWWGNTTDNTRFSPLTQINSATVGKLGLAWTAQEGGNLLAWETDPVVVQGVMYYTTNLDQVRAVNAATGKRLWQYTPRVNFFRAIAGGGGGVPTNRGVTVANGKVYLLTFDDQLIALQAATGDVVWHAQVADASQGYSETSPPTYWNGLLFVGSAESDAGLRGFVAAYNATTGKQVWRFFTVPAPGQDWVPKVGHHGGGDVWMPQVIDTTTGILYFGTGNPSPDFNNSQRAGSNPWVDATVALNARTGQFLWAHTEVSPDVWDYDSGHTAARARQYRADAVRQRRRAYASD
jgi:glucose dehydrogenase